jgi:hypothetical protein
MISTSITREQAIQLAESGFWKTMPARDLFEFQLYTKFLAMPFTVFHKAAEATLGRTVYVHEFAHPKRLKRELRGEKPAPTFDEIMALIPADKLVLVLT